MSVKYNLSVPTVYNGLLSETHTKCWFISEEELENSDLEHSPNEDLKDAEEKPKKKKRRRREVDMVSKLVSIFLL